MLWHSVSKGRPLTSTPVALKCVTSDDDVTYALGWFNQDQNEWWITADPIHAKPTEITHWCELADTEEANLGSDPWPI
jgi:hypothetical protein